MKLDFTVLLPELDVETDSDHGSIEAVWFDGEDWSNRTVAELVLAHFGELCWREKIILETEKTLESKGAKRVSF